MREGRKERRLAGLKNIEEENEMSKALLEISNEQVNNQ